MIALNGSGAVKKRVTITTINLFIKNLYVRVIPTNERGRLSLRKRSSVNDCRAMTRLLRVPYHDFEFSHDCICTAQNDSLRPKVSLRNVSMIQRNKKENNLKISTPI